MQTGYANPGHSVIYKANPQFVEMVRKVREDCRSICSGHMNRPVRVETIDGHVYEGRIVHADRHCLYLETAPETRGYFYNPYYSTILPLVLFDLLAITLLYP